MYGRVTPPPGQSNEAENREQDWGETPQTANSYATIRHATISLLILRKKPTVLQSSSQQTLVGSSFAGQP